MAVRICPQCGAPVPHTATECEYCGSYMGPAQEEKKPAGGASGGSERYSRASSQDEPHPTPFMTAEEQRLYRLGINPNWPIRSKVVAALLAIFLGGLGLHCFYLGRIGKGIVYLIFSWTFLPSMVGFFEGLYYLITDDVRFQQRYRVRIR